MNYEDFFKRAMGGERGAYGYQRELACGKQDDRAESEWLANAAACRSLLIDIQTGLGKTAAVVLAWLWNRVALQRNDWPRRLVYCLPMRTLVEQTESEVKRWTGNLLENSNGLSNRVQEDLKWLHERSPIILMGGEEPDGPRKEWDLHPEKPAILIGTQDMLLSRANNSKR